MPPEAPPPGTQEIDGHPADVALKLYGVEAVKHRGPVLWRPRVGPGLGERVGGDCGGVAADCRLVLPSDGKDGYRSTGAAATLSAFCDPAGGQRLLDTSTT